MKTLFKNSYGISACFLMIVLLTGCGKGDDKGGAPAAAANNQNQCPQQGQTIVNGQCVYPNQNPSNPNGGWNVNTGFVFTAQFGWLQQGKCQAGQGEYNGTCVAGTPGTPGGSGNPIPPPPGTNPGTGSCPSGQVFTSKGCLPQMECDNLGCRYCPPGMGLINKVWCVK